ncbi:MAG: hypothetical protein ABSG79_23400 [Bryobacteraceae bacterium]|jgi:hypothetical protein
MHVEKIWAELRRERDLIEKVIVNIENPTRKGKRGGGRAAGLVTKSKQDETMTPASEA